MVKFREKGRGRGVMGEEGEMVVFRMGTRKKVLEMQVMVSTQHRST